MIFELSEYICIFVLMFVVDLQKLEGDTHDI